mgnify:CR=1 FL=1
MLPQIRPKWVIVPRKIKIKFFRHRRNFAKYRVKHANRINSLGRKNNIVQKTYLRFRKSNKIVTSYIYIFFGFVRRLFWLRSNIFMWCNVFVQGRKVPLNAMFSWNPGRFKNRTENLRLKIGNLSFKMTYPGYAINWKNWDFTNLDKSPYKFS